MTLLQSYLRSANFRRWLATPGCPPIITAIQNVLQKTFWHTKYQERSDTFQPIPKEVANYPMDNVSFSRATYHAGNSVVLYRNSSLDEEVRAGAIQKIELHGDKKFCYVTEHASLPSNLHDPFARYPDFPAVTYSSQLLPGTTKIEMKDIVTHAARFHFSHERTVFLSLSRVRSFSFCRNTIDRVSRFLSPIG